MRGVPMCHHMTMLGGGILDKPQGHLNPQCPCVFTLPARTMCRAHAWVIAVVQHRIISIPQRADGLIDYVINPDGLSTLIILSQCTQLSW